MTASSNVVSSLRSEFLGTIMHERYHLRGASQRGAGRGTLTLKVVRFEAAQ
jgi:hypothetical protein